MQYILSGTTVNVNVNANSELFRQCTFVKHLYYALSSILQFWMYKSYSLMRNTHYSKLVKVGLKLGLY